VFGSAPADIAAGESGPDSTRVQTSVEECAADIQTSSIRLDTADNGIEGNGPGLFINPVVLGLGMPAGYKT
jgi:hypothetical protein